MKRYRINTGTVTYAIKGRDVLNKNGYNAKVEKINRTKNKTGCGYAVTVSGDISEIKSLLKANAVKILDITEIS